ncbi:MAG TPA: MFS transporter, partial [Solirubrobacteraceae bacterium]|nr:MFS transporter [Solirubrobacteraceae bacterium]
MSTPAAARAVTVRTPGFLVGVLGTAFVVALGFGLIAPILPLFADALGASYSGASLVITVFAGVRLLSSAPAGALVDRVGARATVAAGLLIVAASSAATAYAATFLQLLVLRGAGGVGSALFITGLGQHIVRLIPPAERGRANGMLQGAFLLGGVSGPVVGGYLVQAGGFEPPFLIYAAGLVVATVVTLRFLSTSTHAGEAATTIADAEFGATDDHVVAPTHAATAAPPGIGAMLRDRTFLAALVVAGAVSWGSQGVRLAAVPLFGDDVLHLEPGVVGLALTVASACHALMLWPSSQYADRRGRRTPLRVGTAVYVVAMFGLAFATDAAGLIIALGAQGLAAGAASTMPSAVVGDLAPPGAEGKAVGVLSAAQDVAV